MNAGTRAAVQKILDLTENTLGKYPARIPGTPDCRNAAGDTAGALAGKNEH